MKRNIIYMVGALLSSAILTFSCSDDDAPTYSEMAVDKTDIFIQADGEHPTAEVNITNGNGNYKITVADENIATASINGTIVTFTGLKNGVTTATIMDWAKHSTTINVRVKEDFDMELGKDELTLIKDVNPTELVNIKSGNGEYKVISSNEEVVTATLTEDGKIEVTALNNGHAEVTVTDADGKKATLKVTAAEHLLELDAIPTAWKANTDKTINIKSGNGEYKATTDNEEVATAEIIENSEEGTTGLAVKITGNKAGEATIIITDKMELSVSVEVKVKNPMSVEATSIDELIIGGETKDILISGGSGVFECSGKNVEGTISKDGTKVTLKGTERAGYIQGAMLTLTDKEFGETIDIKVNKVDVPFLETKSIRYNIGGWIASPATSKKGTSSGKNKISMGDEEKNWMGRPNGKLIYGYNLYFSDEIKEGDITTDVKLMHIGSSGDKEDYEITIANLKIEKIEDGWIWFTFEETEHPEYGKSYLVVNT